MANGYQDGLTIDRIDVNGNYESSNCRWATYKEQENNRRNNRYITICGCKKTLTQWADFAGISSNVLSNRISYGWPEKDLLIPANLNNKNLRKEKTMLNRVILMGRLTHNPELKTTTNGADVCSFDLAVGRPGTKDKTDFITCVAWRNTAIFVSKWFTKGNMIAIEGSLHTSNYEDKNGNKRKAVEVVVDRAFFVGAKSGGAQNNAQQSEAPAISAVEAFAGGFTEIDANEEDLPF